MYQVYTFMSFVPLGCVVALGLVGCSAGKDVPADSTTTTPNDSDEPNQTETGDPDEPAQEECDGIDNDSDGLVDEGFDLNDDGIIDCFQCEIEDYKTKNIENYYEYCEYNKEISNFEWKNKWSYSPDAGDFQWVYGCINPRVADLNKDGNSDILCSIDNSLYAVNGEDGSMLWIYDENVTIMPATSVLDSDMDEWIEVLFIDNDGRLIYLDGYDGSIKFKSKEIFSTNHHDWYYECENYSGGFSGDHDFSYVYQSDMDHDGEWELLTPQFFVDANSGESFREFSHFNNDCDYLNVFRNGFDVIFYDENMIFMDSVYNSDGYKERDFPMDPIQGDILNGYYLINSVIVEADGDDFSEFVFINHNEFVLLDDDGSELSRTEMFRSPALYNTSYSCAGDVDGDGVSEIFSTVGAFAEYYKYTSFFGAWSLDGNLMWSKDIILHGTGQCTVFDFNNDGLNEVVFSDEDYIYMVSGIDGEEIISIERSTNYSWMGLVGAVSLIVDLDGDGSVEWVIASPMSVPGGEPALRVLSHVDGGWAPGGRIWPWSSWSGVGMRSDGRPQTDQPPSSVYPGRFRGQAQVHVDGADLRPVVLDSCVSLGEVRLSVAVENLGPYEMNGKIDIEAVDTSGAVVASGYLLRVLEAGQRSETVELLLTREQVADGVDIRVRTDVSHDCNQDNNTLRWEPGGTE